MANQVQPDGSRKFDDVYTFPQDSQDLADDIFKASTVPVGTSAARQAMAAARQRAGMLFSESDNTALYRSDGAGAWELLLSPLKAYDASPSGLTVGNGSLSTKYEQRGKLVTVVIELLFGSTTVLTGNLQFQPPLAPKTPTVFKHMGAGLIRLAAGNQWSVQARMAGSQSINISALNASGAAGTPIVPGANVSNTWPTSAAWGAGGSLYVEWTYEAA